MASVFFTSNSSSCSVSFFFFCPFLFIFFLVTKHGVTRISNWCLICSSDGEVSVGAYGEIWMYYWR